MWRDAVEPGNLIELELPCFQELCFFRRDADLLVLHAFFQHSHLVGIARPPVDGIPRIPDFGRILQNAWMFQHPAGAGPVRKERGTVFLAGHGHAHGIAGHGNRRITDQAVKPKAGDMQHFFLLQGHLTIRLDVRILISRLGIQIKNLSPVIPADGHLVRPERV